MKQTCKDCGKQEACLLRTMGIFQHYIATGRIDELTPEVHKNFCVPERCKSWQPAATQPAKEVAAC